MATHNACSILSTFSVAVSRLTGMASPWNPVSEAEFRSLYRIAASASVTTAVSSTLLVTVSPAKLVVGLPCRESHRVNEGPPPQPPSGDWWSNKKRQAEV